ncbi:hypothetical protein APH_0958 [Anaplasma phagocytophilum str. HZ]|uniref:Uncharacterized protein n=1 Tax=Anaplasma phagocytophilum (strain HZ) TaxID=212042 RepID=Q2GJC5_ANAPZ|nr:hypothetical protein APH_0958 [Anaplasma phagocytophilum str. HZ]
MQRPVKSSRLTAVTEEIKIPKLSRKVALQNFKNCT